MVHVPGPASDPRKSESIVYRKSFQLLSGDWNRACLHLNGARFDPAIFINGASENCGNREDAGGMAQLTFDFSKNQFVKPDGKISLEITLKSLSDLNEENASRIPEADRWRSNVSSCLWDKVEIHFSKDGYSGSIIPQYIENEDSIRFDLAIEGSISGHVFSDKLTLEVSDGSVFNFKVKDSNASKTLKIKKSTTINFWHPIQPDLYKWKFMFKENKKIKDQSSLQWAPKFFKV